MNSLFRQCTYFLLILILCSCNQKSHEQTNKKTTDDSEDHSAHTEMEMRTGEPTDESIYNVTSTWKNRNGNKLELSSLQGKIQIVAMVYTHCEFACPRILADMKRIEKEFDQEELTSINFLIVSIDPERDTPKKLKNFAGENNLDQNNWTLLNGSQGDILELSALLGVKYKKISETDFTHSNMLTVLNQEGEIIHQRLKLGNNTEPIIESIRKAL